MATERGLCGLAFADSGEEKAALADMRSRWPKAKYAEDSARTAPLAARIFDKKLWRPDQPLRVVLIGTDFEVRVWETLLRIPMGRATTYSDIAGSIGKPKAPARGRRRGRQEPDQLRRALPPRARQVRRAHRLSLGHHPQARHARLGGRQAWRRSGSAPAPSALIDGGALIAENPANFAEGTAISCRNAAR